LNIAIHIEGLLKIANAIFLEFDGCNQALKFSEGSPPPDVNRMLFVVGNTVEILAPGLIQVNLPHHSDYIFKFC